MRCLTLLCVIGLTGCLYEYDFETEESERANCTGHWDCSGENEICGAIVSEPHDNPCGDNSQWWLGVDSEETSPEGFDEDSVMFLCVGERRYFPLCTNEAKMWCDGACGSDIAEDRFLCGTRVDEPNTDAVCVLNPDPNAPECANSGGCGDGECVRLFTATENTVEYRQVCALVHEPPP